MNIVMCPTKYFGVDYEINPWMHLSDQPDLDIAKKQWEDIESIFEEIGINVDVINPEKGFPDMVFVANAGLPMKDKFILSNFTHKERQGEVEFFRKYFSKKFEVIELPEDIKFEGQGDAFFVGKKLFIGNGFRSSEKAGDYIKEYLPDDYKIIKLNLINQNFYHLDTAIAYIGDDNFLVVKSAFSDDSLEILKRQGNLIFLSDEDAKNFAANNIIYKENIILNDATPELEKKLNDLDLNVIKKNTSEFLKSGGSVRCLSLVY